MSKKSAMARMRQEFDNHCEKVAVRFPTTNEEWHRTERSRMLKAIVAAHLKYAGWQIDNWEWNPFNESFDFEYEACFDTDTFNSVANYVHKFVLRVSAMRMSFRFGAGGMDAELERLSKEAAEVRAMANRLFAPKETK